MTIEERVAKVEARLGANDELVMGLRDAMIATAHMEAHQSRLLKDHAVWLQEQDAAIVASRRESEEWKKVMDERIANLVSGFGEFMRRLEKR